jgi:hypothetical protein
MYRRFSFPVLKTSHFITTKAVTVSRRQFLKFYEFIWIFNQFGQISGYFQYQVSGWISEKSNPVSYRILDLKKAGLSSQPDIRCTPCQFFKFIYLVDLVDIQCILSQL